MKNGTLILERHPIYARMTTGGISSIVSPSIGSAFHKAESGIFRRIGRQDDCWLGWKTITNQQIALLGARKQTVQLSRPVNGSVITQKVPATWKIQPGDTFTVKERFFLKPARIKTVRTFL